MKLLAAVFGMIVVVAVSVSGFARWDRCTNRGYRFGYYGEFNTMSNGLASIPGVIVTNSWYNPDICIEEFGFGITSNGKPARVEIPENDPIRTLKSDVLSSALRTRIRLTSAP
jgi:hypothetical protein